MITQEDIDAFSYDQDNATKPEFKREASVNGQQLCDQKIYAEKHFNIAYENGDMP